MIGAIGADPVAAVEEDEDEEDSGGCVDEEDVEVEEDDQGGSLTALLLGDVRMCICLFGTSSYSNYPTARQTCCHC